MSTFIVRIELHPSDQLQEYSAVHDAMAAAGFSRIYRDRDGLRYHLPASEYCIKSARSVEAIRDLAATAAGKVTSLFMLLVSETTRIATMGLVRVREATEPAEQAGQTLPSPSATAQVSHFEFAASPRSEKHQSQTLRPSTSAVVMQYRPLGL
jgi:hypothetical protein